MGGGEISWDAFLIWGKHFSKAYGEKSPYGKKVYFTCQGGGEGGGGEKQVDDP